MEQNWDDLRLFLAVAREESLSGAGKLLRLDPATLGRRMARLEKSLQTVLFVKSPQGYALTEAGSDLMQRAEPRLLRKIPILTCRSSRCRACSTYHAARRIWRLG